MFIDKKYELSCKGTLDIIYRQLFIHLKYKIYVFLSLHKNKNAFQLVLIV